jgi:Do/DeqQ family serine protease
MIRNYLLWILTATLTGFGVACAAQPVFMDEDRGIPTFAPVIRTIAPAVVNVAVVSEAPTSVNPLFNDPFFRDFFDLPPGIEPQPRLSAGSGVIVDARQGYILTNSHVIENAREIHITLTDRRTLAAEIIGSDPATDIAVLKVDANDLTEIELGDAETLEVGDFVVAIGNPFGLGQTVTSGIVSALGRTGINPEGYEDFIQTDASINPGNSGGALATLDGKLIGVNTAIIAPSGGNVGIGFAVPINMAGAVMKQLIAHGEVRRGQLGVTIQDVTPDLAQALGIKADRGAIISQVLEGSAAETAGLRSGDVVLAVDGVRVEDAGDLRNLVGMTPPGASVELELERDGRIMTVSMRIGGAARSEMGEPATASPLLEGARLSPLGPEMPGYGDVEGVAVVSVVQSSPADRAGLRTGDVITAVNNEPVTSVEELTSKLTKRGDSPMALTVYRNGSAIYLVVR